MSFVVPFQLLTCTSKSGTKNGRDWIITEAKGMLKVTDREGNVNTDIATVMMPKGAPLQMPQGLYDLHVEHYIDRENKLQFAIRKVEPAKQQTAAK